MEPPNPDKPTRAQTELDAALLHHELIVAALQSHERLAQIEDEYQAKISAYWAEVEIHIRHGVALRTKRHAEEVAYLNDVITECRKQVAYHAARSAALSKKLLAKKKRPKLTASKAKPRKASK